MTVTVDHNDSTSPSSTSSTSSSMMVIENGKHQTDNHDEDDEEPSLSQTKSPLSTTTTTATSPPKPQPSPAQRRISGCTSPEETKHNQFETTSRGATATAAANIDDRLEREECITEADAEVHWTGHCPLLNDGIFANARTASNSLNKTLSDHLPPPPPPSMMSVQSKMENYEHKHDEDDDGDDDDDDDDDGHDEINLTLTRMKKNALTEEVAGIESNNKHNNNHNNNHHYNNNNHHRNNNNNNNNNNIDTDSKNVKNEISQKLHSSCLSTDKVESSIESKLNFAVFEVDATTTTTTTTTKTTTKISLLPVQQAELPSSSASSSSTQHQTSSPSSTSSTNCRMNNKSLQSIPIIDLQPQQQQQQQQQHQHPTSPTSSSSSSSSSSTPATSSSTILMTTGNRKPKSFSAIPGPWPSLPFVGTGWQYFPIIGRYALGKLHEAHLAKFHDYGPIVREEYQWGRAIVHIFDPEDFETVFRSQGRCPVRPPNEFVTSLRSRKPEMYPNVGFANLNGEPWLELRQKLAPGIMKMRAVIETLNDQNAILDDFLDFMSQGANPETEVFDNMQEVCYRLALESICLVCLGSRIGSFRPDTSGKEPASRLIEATKLMFDAFNRLYYGPSFWKYFTTGAYNDLERSETEIYEVASKYIEEEMIRLNDEPEAEQKYNVLQTLLATPGLSAEDVKVTVIDFIVGGIFTVSNSLACLCYHLAANNDVQEKLAEEIQTVLSASNRRGKPEVMNSRESCEWITSADIASMPYLKACVRESFRLNCPVPGIMRVTSKPLVLSGYEIPENTSVFSHIMSTCRLEKYFPEADLFKPERWLQPEARSKIHPFASLPFGFGSRMCVGKRFSENEIYLAAARLIARYRIQLPAGDCGELKHQPLELKHAFIVIPAKPISLKLSPR